MNIDSKLDERWNFTSIDLLKKLNEIVNEMIEKNWTMILMKKNRMDHDHHLMNDDCYSVDFSI